MTAVALHAATPTLAIMRSLARTEYDAEEIERLDLPRSADALDSAARATSVPVEVLLAVAWCESRFDARAVGDKGRALGLCQITPEAAVGHISPSLGGLSGGWELWPETNALVAARILARPQRGGRWSMRRALERYAGSGPKARAYAARVLAVVARIERRAVRA